MPRTILVHLNLEVPDTLVIDNLANLLAEEILGALDVGMNAEDTPLLATAIVAAPLAEEI